MRGKRCQIEDIEEYTLVRNAIINSKISSGSEAGYIVV